MKKIIFYLAAISAIGIVWILHFGIENAPQFIFIVIAVRISVLFAEWMTKVTFKIIEKNKMQTSTEQVKK